MRLIAAACLVLSVSYIAGCGDSAVDSNQRNGVKNESGSLEYSQNDDAYSTNPGRPVHFDGPVTNKDQVLIDRMEEKVAHLDSVAKWDKQAQAHAEALLHADDWRGRCYLVAFVMEACLRDIISVEKAQAYLKRAHDLYPKEAGFLASYK